MTNIIKSGLALALFVPTFTMGASVRENNKCSFGKEMGQGSIDLLLAA